MPALPFVPNVVKAQLQFQRASEATLYTNLFFRYSGGPPNASEALSLASSIFTAAHPIVVECHSFVVLTAVRVTDLSADDTGDALHEGSDQGQQEGGALPANIAALVNFTIGRRYRGGKPRNYFPMGDDAAVLNPQAWNGTFITNATAAFSSFVGTVLGTTAGSTTLTAHVNVSYYSGSVGSIVDGGTRGKTTPIRRTTPVVDDILGFSVAPRIASQRRRLGR